MMQTNDMLRAEIISAISALNGPSAPDYRINEAKRRLNDALATSAAPSGIEAIEHGTLKREAFANDLAYGIYLSERAEAERSGKLADDERRINASNRAIAQEERACRAEDALLYLVKQISKTSPIDDHGHKLTMNMAYIKAVELINDADIAPRALKFRTDPEADSSSEWTAADQREEDHLKSLAHDDEEINPYVVQTADSSSAAQSDYKPEYKTLTDHKGKVTGVEWVNADKAPRVSALAAPAPTGERLSALPRCTECDGTGGDDIRQCETCAGMGYIQDDLAPRATLAAPASTWESLSIDYTRLHAYADTHNLNYNELCVAVRVVARTPCIVGSIGSDAKFRGHLSDVMACRPEDQVHYDALLVAYIDARAALATPRQTEDGGLSAAIGDIDQVPHLIVFDDTERKSEMVIGETRARYRFKEISTSWNAHLYVKIASNSRDDKYPNAAFAPKEPAAQGGVPDVVEYQYRTRADWHKNWTEWEKCSAESYTDYVKAPLVNDWHHEVRALSLAAAPAPTGTSK